MRKFTFDREKFKRLVHYIIWKCPDPAKLGSTKLHKILWKSDTGRYLQTGAPLTGARYVKRQYGPCAPALDEAIAALVSEGAIRTWRDRKFAGDKAKDVFVAERPAPTDFLSAEERITVDHWISTICLKHTAKSISDESHGLAWEIAKMGEDLPMQAILAETRGREPNEEELAWARERAKARGLI
jgi:hypothetical protein